MELIKRLNFRIGKSEDVGLFHNSRGDVQKLAKAINEMIDKQNEMIDAINLLIKAKKDGEPHA